MSRKIKFSEGEYYHIYNRGIDKRIIFSDKYDYDRFLLLLNVCNSTEPINIRDTKIRNQSRALGKENHELVNIGAWCLMPNHFHFLVCEKIDNGIPLFFHRLFTAYSMYFNKKYSRNGPLFAGRFKAKHADSDDYLKYLYSYIHLNPIKLLQPDWREKGIKNIKEAKIFLNSYEYSSYLDYSGISRTENKIINTKAFPEYFCSKEVFSSDVFDWLDYQRPGLGNFT